LRQEQIRLQVALITPLIHIKGYSALETKAAIEQARLLLEQAEALGEHPEDPLLLFSVLYGLFVANVMAFNGDVSRDIALMFRGDFVEGRAHLDQAIALYDPDAHRSLAARFGEDQTVATLGLRSRALWLLGYPEAALRDAHDALKRARETGEAASLMFALHFTAVPLILCGSYTQATAFAGELRALADEKEVPFWKVNGSLNQGCLFALTGDAPDKAVQMITSGITALLPTGVTLGMPWWLLHLATAHANLHQFDDAWRYITEAASTTKNTRERWPEAEVNRAAGEIALRSPERRSKEAEEYFQRALAVARQQQAKSWELRASMSLARLWRDQGKVQQARELLAPVYGWFSEGFDTRDLKEAKALLEELAA
jgi:predicted ATPase